MTRLKPIHVVGAVGLAAMLGGIAASVDECRALDSAKESFLSECADGHSLEWCAAEWRRVQRPVQR